MRTLRVGIATYEQMKARTVAIARGEYRPPAGEPNVSELGLSGPTAERSGD